MTAVKDLLLRQLRNFESEKVCLKTHSYALAVEKVQGKSVISSLVSFVRKKRAHVSYFLSISLSISWTNDASNYLSDSNFLSPFSLLPSFPPSLSLPFPLSFLRSLLPHSSLSLPFLPRTQADVMIWKWQRRVMWLQDVNSCFHFLRWAKNNVNVILQIRLENAFVIFEMFFVLDMLLKCS